MRILLADTETSGLSKKDGICELAFIEVNPELEVITEWGGRIDPECPISPSAAGVHGITDADVEHEPTMAEAMEILEEKYGLFDDILLIAHNVPFDLRFLRPYWNVSNTFCTLKAARRVWPDAPDHKLQTLKHFLGLEVSTTVDDAHSALGDTRDLFALLKRLIKDSEMDLFDLMGFAMRPEIVTHMPFGKHKGTPLEDLPGQYRSWLLALDDLDDSLRWSLVKL